MSGSSESPIVLWSHQNIGIDLIKDSFRTGHRAPLYQGATGSGKSNMFGAICKGAADKGHSVTIAVHRQELLEQVSEMLWSFGQSHSFIAPGYYYDPQERVQVASIFSLARRLNKVRPCDLFIIDEAHHAILGSTWHKVLAAYPNAYRCGFSATPCRLSGEPLSDLFDDLILGPTVRELIDGGYLSDYKLYAPSTVDTSMLHKIGGDFKKDEMQALMDKPRINGDALTQYKKYADGKRAVAFCVSVEHAHHVAQEFSAAGYPSLGIDGTMDSSHRRSIVEAFKRGELKLLTSCSLLDEGFDCPGIEAALFLRPTASLSLFLQQAGRTIRRAPGKTHAILLDFVAHTSSHGLIDDEREWSLEGNVQKKRRKKDPAEATKICVGCFLVVKRTASVCPGCGHVFATFPREIECDSDADLNEISDEQLKQMRRRRRAEQSSAQDLASLIALGKSRGYRNPYVWASAVLKSRQSKQSKKFEQEEKTEWLSF